MHHLKRFGVRGVDTPSSYYGMVAGTAKNNPSMTNFYFSPDAHRGNGASNNFGDGNSVSNALGSLASRAGNALAAGARAVGRACQSICGDCAGAPGEGDAPMVGGPLAAVGGPLPDPLEATLNEGMGNYQQLVKNTVNQSQQPGHDGLWLGQEPTLQAGTNRDGTMATRFPGTMAFGPDTDWSSADFELELVLDFDSTDGGLAASLPPGQVVQTSAGQSPWIRANQLRDSTDAKGRPKAMADVPAGKQTGAKTVRAMKMHEKHLQLDEVQASTDLDDAAKARIREGPLYERYGLEGVRPAMGAHGLDPTLGPDGNPPVGPQMAVQSREPGVPDTPFLALEKNVIGSQDMAFPLEGLNAANPNGATVIFPDSRKFFAHPWENSGRDVAAQTPELGEGRVRHGRYICFLSVVNMIPQRLLILVPKISESLTLLFGCVV